MTSIILILAVLNSQDLSGDTYQDELIMTDRDSHVVDMESLMWFDSSSIDFVTNTKGVEIPGVSDKASTVYFTDKAFQPLNLKSAKNYIVFNAANDRVMELQLEEQNVNRLDSGINSLLKESPDFKIMDLAIDQLGHFFVLCKNKKDSGEHIDRQSEYMLVISDYFKHRAKKVTFNAGYMAEPRLKILSPVGDVHKMSALSTFALLVFDRSPTLRKSPKLSVLLLSQHQTEGGVELSLADVRTLSVDALLFNQVRELIVENVMIRSEEQFEVYLLVKEAGVDESSKDKSQTKKSLSQSYVCAVMLTDSLAELSITNCRLFINNVKWFFLKQSNYIYLDDNDYIMFCSLRRDKCKAGEVEDDWAIEFLLLEEQTAVVAMAIKQTRIVFINNFASGEFVWFKMAGDAKIIKPYLISAYDQQQPTMKLLQFHAKGFSFKDISINKEMKINAALIHSFLDATHHDRLLHLYLDQQKVVELDVQIIKRDAVVPLHRHKRDIVVKDDGVFAVKLNLGGSLLRFKPTRDQRILHVNSADLSLQDVSGEDVELGGDALSCRVYSVDDSLYMFTSADIRRFHCELDKLALKHTCVLKASVSASTNIKDVKHIRRIASMMVLIPEHGADLVSINTRSLAPVVLTYPDSIKDAADCDVLRDKLVCRYKQADRDLLRIFELAEDHWVEHNYLHISIDLFVKDVLVKSTKYNRVAISQYAVSHDGVIVMFSFYTAGSVFNRVYSFASVAYPTYLATHSHHPSLNKSTLVVALDNAVLYLSVYPGYKLYAYIGSSYAEFDYVDAKELIDVDFLHGMNMLGLTYLSHAGTVRFALYRITTNAAKQLIADMALDITAESLAALRGSNEARGLVELLQLDDATVGVLTKFDGHPRLVVFFDDGPFMLASDVAAPVEVNDKVVSLNIVEDKTANMFCVKQLKPTHVVLDKAIDVVLIEDFVLVVGNLIDLDIISQDDQAKGDSAHGSRHVEELGVELFSPLQPKHFEILSPIHPSHAFVTNKHGLAFLFDDHYTVITSAAQTVTLAVVYKNDAVVCDDIALTQSSFICLHAHNQSNVLSVVSLSSKTQQDYVLEHRGSALRVLNDSSYLTFSLLDAASRQVVVYEIDTVQSVVAIHAFGRRHLHSDQLRIADYHVSADSDLKTTTVLLLNTLANRLHIVHLDVDYQPLKTFRTHFALHKFGDITRLFCIDVNDNVSSLVFDCDLHTVADIKRVRVKKVIQDDSFHWNLELLSSFKAFFVHDHVTRHPYVSHSSQQYIVVGQQHHLILYKLNTNSPYVHHIHVLPTSSVVLSVQIAGTQLVAHAVVDGHVVVHKFAIDCYSLKLHDPSLLLNKRLDLIAHSKHSHQRISFTFANDAGSAVTYKPVLSNTFLLLSCAVGVAALLVLLAFTWLLIVCLDRNRKLAELAKAEA